MDITVLKQHIMRNELKHVYVFTGDELGIQKIYLNQMSKVLNMPIIRADSTLQVYNKCTTKSLFGNSNGFYVIRNDFDIQKQENFYTKLAQNIGDNYIVLQYDKVDSRLKFGKFFKDSLVPFEKLAPNVLRSYIMREADLETQDAELLATKVGGSYDLAMLEIDKIHQYGESTDKVDAAAFHDLLNSGVIYQPQEVTVFDFVDKVCNRKLEAFDLAQVLLDNKVSSINILGTLYNSMKSVLLIQCCTSRDIGNVTGLDNGQIYFNRKYVNRYRTDKLVEIVQFLIDVIDGIKSGRIEDGYALKYSLVHIFN